MPLTSTQQLIKEYGEKLKNGTITDAEIEALNDDKRFEKSPGYADPNKPITDTNHSKLNALQDFVATIGPQVSQDIFSQLTARFIVLSAEKLGKDKNAFMRGSTLEKCFLAYELAHSPETAETHFQEDSTIRHIFKTEQDITHLKTVILMPGITTFKNLKEEDLVAKATQVMATKERYLKTKKIPFELAQQIEIMTLRLMDKNKSLGPAHIGQYENLIRQVKETEKHTPDTSPSKKGYLSSLMNLFLNLVCYMLFIKRASQTKDTAPQQALSDIMQKHVDAYKSEEFGEFGETTEKPEGEVPHT
ncbi:MAG: hypothetical protein K0U37_05025 [Gammaproteobacteria bacterium]|nr:hypothetical protein [Gammaproteobacteria bacterium]